MGTTGCTAGWVFAGQRQLRGQQFIATARHCVSGLGEAVYLTAGPFPVSFAHGLLIGRVAYVSKGWDFALIRIAPTSVRYVVPSMAGHPDIPRGVGGTSSAKFGDICQFSGHGLGFDGTPTTEQSRVGVLTDISNDELYCDGPANEGDSGGPIADLTSGNEAIGLLDGIDATAGGSSANVGVHGVTMTVLLRDAAAHRHPVRLRTAASS